MNLIIAKNYDELSKKAAIIVLNQIIEKPSSVIGLVIGTTPLGLYRELIKESRKGNFDFSKIFTFSLDELVGLNKKHPLSHANFLEENLLSQLNIKPENTHFLNGKATDFEKECWQYEKKISVYGLDLQILGIGGNGHIGFLEPGENFKSRTHLVNLNHLTVTELKKHFKDKRNVPTKALTMGFGTIMEAKKIILLASGLEKAEAISLSVEGRVTPDIPASILQKHPNTTIIIDEKAASKLKYKDFLPKIAGKSITIINEKSLPKGKKILVISPHPDDAAISSGGAIARLARKNKINCLVMTTGHRAYMPRKTRIERIEIREKEASNEARLLGMKPFFLRLKFYDLRTQILEDDLKKVFNHLESIKPDIIFIPQENDTHPTHQICRQLILKSIELYLDKYSVSLEMWNYEDPWALFSPGKFNTVFPLEKIEVEKKIEAIRAHRSQTYRIKYDRAVLALLKFRGTLTYEQLSGYGQKLIKTLPKSKYVELYNISEGGENEF